MQNPYNNFIITNNKHKSCVVRFDSKKHKIHFSALRVVVVVVVVVAANFSC